ncbi:unnamed protein product [marine sediment metagenome]|uniref:Uncharacterized protein n=1 Tax=marine sediment metagenome TaxID=412755 RepID=X0RPQ6_9ZZZZ
MTGQNLNHPGTGDPDRRPDRNAALSLKPGHGYGASRTAQEQSFGADTFDQTAGVGGIEILERFRTKCDNAGVCIDDRDCPPALGLALEYAAHGFLQTL